MYTGCVTYFILSFSCFDFSSLGEQGNIVSKSLALRESALSLACTGILETVEVGLLMKLFSVIHRNSLEFIIFVSLIAFWFQSLASQLEALPVCHLVSFLIKYWVMLSFTLDQSVPVSQTSGWVMSRVCPHWLRAWNGLLCMYRIEQQWLQKLAKCFKSDHINTWYFFNMKFIFEGKMIPFPKMFH